MYILILSILVVSTGTTSVLGEHSRLHDCLEQRERAIKRIGAPPEKVKYRARCVYVSR